MKRKTRPEARVALCYVRKSFVRKRKAPDKGDPELAEPADQVSPNRQRKMIEAVCQARGWTAEFYVDAHGHRSGRTEKREEWQALRSRLHDPDVAALVAYDLSRLHRKGYRIGALLDECEQDGIAVVMAAAHQQIDFSTPVGKMIATIIAMMDEMYAEDVSQRMIAAAEHRKAQGKSMGRPVFGTRRGRDGYLVPSSEGAWILPGGTVTAGSVTDPPVPGAVWRGYYDCARRILELYAGGALGYHGIMRIMNDEGWRFRDDRGVPSPLHRSDVVRIVRQWPEYGGLVLPTSYSARRETDAVPPLDPARAVFPVELLNRVRDVRLKRSVSHVPDRGHTLTSYPYPLAGLLYCAHCDAHPIDPGSRRMSRSRLGGKGTTAPNATYRHGRNVLCDAGRRSVRTSVLHQGFSNLLSALSVDPVALEELRHVARVIAEGRERRPPNFEEDKAARIAQCRRKISAAITLFADGRIDEADYRRRVEANERQIAEWLALRSEAEQVRVDVEMTVSAIGNLRRLWDIATDEDRQALVRTLFDELVVDLDRQEITGFRLKPWTTPYVIARASLISDTPKTQGTNVRLNRHNGTLRLKVESSKLKVRFS